MEAQKQLSDECIVDDQVEEAELVNQYMKTQAAATVDFRGEQLGTYGLLKHMQSTDRTERKAAFEAWAKLYAGIAPKLDEVYDGLVKVRSGMAKKLGFESFIPMGYLRRRRFDYTAKDLEVFRKQVREIIVPAVKELYERQKEALGIEHLYYYDESLTSPDGNPVPVGDKEYLVGEAQKMYRELSKESGEFFDFMIEHDLLRPGVETWKARGRILHDTSSLPCTVHLLQLQRHRRRCECPDPRGRPRVCRFHSGKNSRRSRSSATPPVRSRRSTR